MKTDSNSQRIILFLAILVTTALLLFIISKKATAQSSNVPDKDVELQMEHDNSVHMTEMIHAYHRVLHRIWIDRPNYVEDVLCEMDEYIDLEQFLNEDDLKEIYSFHNEEDSLEYHHNWFHEGESTAYKSPLE